MSDFEQIPEIAERIKRSKMELQDNGNYWAPEWDSQSCCDQDFVNNFKKGWLSQQAIIDDLKTQLNNMEACYIEKKKQVDDCAALAKEWRTLAREMCPLDDKYVIGARLGCAQDIEEVLRGEHE